MRTRKPLVYFHALMPGRYYALWPVYVVGDDPRTLTFTVAVDDRNLARLAGGEAHLRVADEDEILARRRHITAITRHRELLDAAHIFFLSVTLDYVIEIRRDVLEEIDGPVLKHALQGLHGKAIHLPRRAANRPDRERLEVRHRRFWEAGRQAPMVRDI